MAVVDSVWMLRRSPGNGAAEVERDVAVRHRLPPQDATTELRPLYIPGDRKGPLKAGKNKTSIRAAGHSVPERTSFDVFRGTVWSEELTLLGRNRRKIQISPNIERRSIWTVVKVSVVRVCVLV